MHDEKFSANAVINRGYLIYDEWTDGKFSSRKVVSCVTKNISLINNKNTKSAYIEALAYLFALDMRIKEKYNTIWKCIFLYFSWRRETRALKQLKDSLHIPSNIDDAHTAIEMSIKLLRERLDSENDYDDDEEIGGGRQNKRSAEENTVTAEKGNEQTADNNANDANDVFENEDSKEASENGADELSEQSIDESNESKDEASQNEELSEQNELTEQSQSDEVKLDELLNQEAKDNLNVENNSVDEQSELSIDKANEAKTYNAAEDIVPPYWESRDNSSSTKESVGGEEFITHNFISGETDNIARNSVDNVESHRGDNSFENAFKSEDKNGESDSKNDYLNDNRDFNKNAEARETKNELGTEKGEIQDLNGKSSEVNSEQLKTEQLKGELPNNEQLKTEQVNEQTSNEPNIEQIKEDFESLSVPLQMEITESEENELRGRINDKMTTEAILEHRRLQAEVMREQLNIASAELGNDANFGIVGKTELSQVKSSGAELNKK